MSTSTVNFSIKLKPSKMLFAGLLSIYGAAIITVALLSVSFWLKTLAILLIIVLSVKTIKRYALFNANGSLSKLVFMNDNKCMVEMNNGKVYRTKILTAQWLFNYFAVLVLKTNKNKLNLTIAKDILSQEQIYALRLYLRSNNT